MSFLSSLVSCCTSDPLSEKHDVETRRARIVTAVNAHSHSDNTSLQPRPRSPRYRDTPPPKYQDIAQHPLITINEKAAADFKVFDADGGDSDPPPSVSPRSSIISIPSTRLTDLTSMPTGETTTSGQRASLERWDSRSTRPPSYEWRGRAPSPPTFADRDEHASEHDQMDEVWLHPVMQDDWLEVLQAAAVRRTTDRSAER